MAKKGLAKYRQQRRRRRKSASSLTKNPPVGQDFVQFILPAFGGYAATRIVARIVYAIVQKRAPRFAKHASAIASVAGFAASWFGAHRVQRLKKYHDALVAGSGVAMLGTLFRTYVPKYGWLVADPTAADYRPALPPKAAAPQQVPQPEPADDYDELEAQAEAMVDKIIGPLPELDEPRGSARSIPSPTVPVVHQIEQDDELGDVLTASEPFGSLSGNWAN